MSKYLAYTRFSRPTGRYLAGLLGLRNFGIRPAREPLETLIRWGSCRKMPDAERVLNPAKAIALASDKLLAIRTLQAAELPTVPAFEEWEAAKAAAWGGCVLGRTRNGMRGQGITVYDLSMNYSGLPKGPRAPHEWYSLYRKPTREVRVHVVDGEVIRIQGKFLDFPELAERDPFIRNHRSGYRYRTPRLKLRKQRQEIAIEAVRALGLHFGAVDMLLFGSGVDPMILEINTAPACAPLTAQSYAEALMRRIET